MAWTFDMNTGDVYVQTIGGSGWATDPWCW